MPRNTDVYRISEDVLFSLNGQFLIYLRVHSIGRHDEGISQLSLSHTKYIYIYFLVQSS
jgi:hypothetical protein